VMSTRLPKEPCAAFLAPWRLVVPREGESARWECIDCPNNKKAELEQADDKKVIEAFVARGNHGRFVMSHGTKEV